MDTNDAMLLALCMWREARGEGTEGMRAVAHVIANRCFDWTKTYHDVILGKNQFSSMSVVSDPEYRLHPAPIDPQWHIALDLARKILTNNDPDNTGGAVFYEVKGTRNAWFDATVVNSSSYTQSAVIGRQVFYKKV